MRESSSRVFKILETILYLIVVGFIILLITFALLREFEWAFAFGSIALAVISLNIGFRSKRIAVDSANANFLNVLSKFEDKRIDLQYHPERKRIHPILIWKALIDLRVAEGLLEFGNIKLQHQRRLMNLLNHLLKYVSRYFIEVLVCEEVAHLLAMSLIGFKVNDELSGNKDEIKGRIRRFFDEQEAEVDEDYISWMGEVIEEDVYQIRFITMRDQYKEWYHYQQDP